MKLLRQVLLTGWLLALPAAAHDGHEHAAAPAVAVPASGGSPLTFSSARLELVAIPGDNAIDVYADDYGSNAPLAGLDVRIQLPTGSIALLEREPGLYSAPLERGAETTPISVHVRGANWSETYSGVIPPATPLAHSPTRTLPWITAAWLLIPLLLVTIAARAFIARRRR